jgi:hypothetical protein
MDLPVLPVDTSHVWLDEKEAKENLGFGGHLPYAPLPAR